MVLKIITVVVIIVAVIVIVAAMQPTDFKVERSLVINAPAEGIYPYFNSPRLFDAFNPFAKQDPKIQLTYSGPESGPGARSSWLGNTQVGEGSVEIIESVPNKRVRVRLDFKKPMEATNYGEYTMAPEGTGTKVTWTMTGQKNLVQKIFCLFMNMDKMVGGEFEKGLVSLRQLVEVK
jgi:hypothetical protein